MAVDRARGKMTNRKHKPKSVVVLIRRPAREKFEAFYTPTRISVKDTLQFGWGGFAPIQTEEADKDWMNRKGAANGVAGSAARTVGLRISQEKLKQR